MQINNRIRAALKMSGLSSDKTNIYQCLTGEKTLLPDQSTLIEKILILLRRVIEELGEKQVEVLRLKSLQVSVENAIPNIFLKMEIVDEIKQVREFGGKVVEKIGTY